MLRVVFFPPSEVEFEKLLGRDSFKNGGGLSDISIFQPRKRGGGILSSLSGIARKVFPFLMKSLKQPVKEFGASALGDVISKKRNFKESVKRHGLKAIKRSGKNMVKYSDGRVRKNNKTRKTSKTYKRSVFYLI